MRLFSLFLIGLILGSCGKDPLSERVEKLEERIDELEAEQEEERSTLLGRLDQVAVTADNADEVNEIRAKLAQTDISRAEFDRLRDRVLSLERRIGDWSQVVNAMKRSVYAVIHAVFVSQDDVIFTFVGTGFAVTRETIVTNGHIIDALVQLDDQFQDFNQRFGTDLQAYWMVVQNLTPSLVYRWNYFFIDEFSTHPQWNAADLSSPDVGRMQVLEGSMPRTIPLITVSEALRLRVGTRVATLGFPGELQGGDLDHLYPIATFKDGTVSAVRPPFQGERYSPRDTYVVQHNLDLSGGTSGSPIFDASGKVLAINNAGIANVVLTLGGAPARISQAALGFGIRADKIHELLNEAGIAAKPVATIDSPGISAVLDGREMSAFEIGTVEDDLTERLIQAAF